MLLTLHEAAIRRADTTHAERGACPGLWRRRRRPKLARCPRRRCVCWPLKTRAPKGRCRRTASRSWRLPSLSTRACRQRRVHRSERCHPNNADRQGVVHFAVVKHVVVVGLLGRIIGCYTSRCRRVLFACFASGRSNDRRLPAYKCRYRVSSRCRPSGGI
jgi:hypothetical protein